VDARKLADLLRTGMLQPVYHGENGLRTLRELARSYQTISKDLNRVMNRRNSRVSSPTKSASWSRRRERRASPRPGRPAAYDAFTGQVSLE
jgi:hypothetical protein